MKKLDTFSAFNNNERHSQNDRFWIFGYKSILLRGLWRVYYILIINPATKLVIPAEAEQRVGIQKRPCNYWIPATGSSPAQAPRERRDGRYQLVYLIARLIILSIVSIGCKL